MPEDGRSPNLVDLAIEPRSIPGGDHGSFRHALDRLASEDPDLQVHIDEQSGQTILSGRDEAHIEAVVERLQAEIPINVGAPQVAYRETITEAVELTYTEQNDRAVESAWIRLRVAPAQSVSFHAVLPDGGLPDEYIVAVEVGVRSVLAAGPVMGFPLVGIDVVLTDGGPRTSRASLSTFEAAGRRALRQALELAAPQALEPIMSIEVLTPKKYVGDIIADLNSRRAMVRSFDQREATYAIAAQVPLADMFGYRDALRTLCHGLASYRLDFDHYERAPGPLDPDDRFPPAMALRA